MDSEGLEANLVDLHLDGTLKNEWIEPKYKLKENEFIEIYQIFKIIWISLFRFQVFILSVLLVIKSGRFMCPILGSVF